MDIASHKMVNGQIVILTEEERNAIEAEWAANESKRQQEEAAKQVIEQEKSDALAVVEAAKGKVATVDQNELLEAILKIIAR